MTEEQLRKIETNCDREDIPQLIAYIRKLQETIEWYKDLVK